MNTVASQITSISIVYSTICLGVDQRKHQWSALLAFVRWIHRWPVNSPHKGPVTRKMFTSNGVIMSISFHMHNGVPWGILTDIIPYQNPWYYIRIFKLGFSLAVNRPEFMQRNHIVNKTCKVFCYILMNRAEIYYCIPLYLGNSVL